MRWEPWSVRQGRRELDEPSEEVEGHMRVVLGKWIAGRLALLAGYTDADALASVMGARLRWEGIRQAHHFLEYSQQDTDTFFDAIEMLLRGVREPFAYGDEKYHAGVENLRTALAVSGSAWTVGPDDKTLTLRVEQTSQDQVSVAVTVEDLASVDLAEAWNRAYGRETDPSDAWDHAIKAVEHIYSPLVLDKQAAQDKSTLGGVIGQLKTNRDGWVAESSTGPSDPSSGVDVIRSMLQALWGNPDRHGGGSSWRAPELAEAQALVNIAVTLVQWGRAGVLRKKVKS